MLNILLVEDNRDLVANVRDYFTSRGHVIDVAMDGERGLQRCLSNHYDVIVLDIGLPKLNGFELMAQLRQQPQYATPIIFLTARDALEDKLRGFELGADDYLTKPFAMSELEARIKAISHRRQNSSNDREILKIDDLVFDTGSLRVSRAGKELSLTPIGRKILALLMHESPRMVTRKRIEIEIWGTVIPDEDVLRTHLYALRRAIDKGREHSLIKTVHREGYRLQVESDET